MSSSCVPELEVSSPICSGDQRAELLRHGLGERIPSVREKATQLLENWFSDFCNRDVVKLLELLDVRSHEGIVRAPAHSILHTSSSPESISRSPTDSRIEDRPPAEAVLAGFGDWSGSPSLFVVQFCPKIQTCKL